MYRLRKLWLGHGTAVLRAAQGQARVRAPLTEAQREQSESRMDGDRRRQRTRSTPKVRFLPTRRIR